MKRITFAMAILFQLVIVSSLKAQIDPHFSQYYADPLWLNPALTGAINGDSRLNINYKNQWATINNAYQTGAVSYDFRPTDRVGIGFSVLNQAAGDAGFNYFSFYGSFSYSIDVSGDGYQQVHFGLQAGMINRSFDLSKIQLDDQYNPLTGYDPSLPGNENFATTGATIFDAGAGVYYFNGDPDNKANLFGGFSVMHLTQPRDPFATEGINSTLPMRFTIHGGLRIHAEDDIDITPHFIYIRQDENQIRALGLYAEFKADNNSGLIAGTMYRIGDAVGADLGYHFNNTIIGLSYDINTSPLNVASEAQGGLELSVSYIFQSHSLNRDVVCPGF